MQICKPFRRAYVFPRLKKCIFSSKYFFFPKEAIITIFRTLRSLYLDNKLSYSDITSILLGVLRLYPKLASGHTVTPLRRKFLYSHMNKQ